MAYIYFDNCATTQPYPEVTAKVVEMLTKKYGNPSSEHLKGRESKKELEEARLEIARSLGALPEEIYFTSGGTESDNLAIKGACLAHSHIGTHIVTTTVEHPAVTKTIRDLKRQGWKVDYISAIGGRLDLDQMEKSINKQTVLVSIMLVNNETGSIFPVEKIKEIIKRKGSPVLLHCDAVQAYGKIPFTAESIGADLISISAHKIHGPKGTGALYVRKGTKMFSLNHGGLQERGLRSGTECMPLIPAFGEAVRITFQNFEQKIAHLKEVRDYCIDRLSAELPNIIFHSTKKGAPHIVNFSLPGFSNKEMASFLDERGIFISSAAACRSNYSRGPSILESFGLTREMASSALRVSFSFMNTKEEVDIFVDTLGEFYRKSL